MTQPSTDEAPARADTPSGAPAAGRSLGGCWKLGGVTCGVLICLFGILALMLFIAIRPQFRRVADQYQEMAQCLLRLQGERGLQGALERYRNLHGEYPARLLDLHPDFLTRRSTFHCPADPAPPDAVSYRYRRPAPDAPKRTIVLSCDHHVLPGLRVRFLVPIEGPVQRDTDSLAPGEGR